MLTFVTFNIDLIEKEIQGIQQVMVGFEHYPAHALIWTLFASAKRFHPDCRTVLLTDQTSTYPDLDCEIIRYPLDRNTLTLSRTRAQLEFLKNGTEASHLLFLDTDMLVQSRLEDIFTCDFDVALTARPHNMPINGGLIMIKAFHYNQALLFMSQLLAHMELKPPPFKKWFGSQLAFKDMLALTSMPDEEGDTVIYQSIRLLILPCDTYNFSPHLEAPQPYPHKRIVHFKGPRKPLQVPYYEKYLA